MSIQNNFYLHLPSNVAGTTATHSLNQYNTNFYPGINLDGPYEVGVSNISFTKSWFNVTDNMASESNLVIYHDTYEGMPYSDGEPLPKPESSRLIDAMKSVIETGIMGIEEPSNIIFSGSDINSFNCLPVLPGNYTIESLIAAINNQIRSLMVAQGVPDRALDVIPRIEYDPNSQSLLIFSGFYVKNGEYHTAIAWIHGPLGDMLGVPRPDVPGSIRWISACQQTVGGAEMKFYLVKCTDCFEMSGGIRLLLVYSDIVRPVRVGDSFAPLLRIVDVPNGIKFGEQVSITFSKVHYVPLARMHINTAEISIKDDLGGLVPFKFGRTVVTLHFRRV